MLGRVLFIIVLFILNRVAQANLVVGLRDRLAGPVADVIFQIYK